MPEFNKPPLDRAALAARLKSRGLIFDSAELESLLKRVSYYRLSGYTRWYAMPPEFEQFKQGTKLEDVTALYNFDSKLRSIILEITEIIEVWLRVAFSDRLANQYDPFAYIDEAYFDPVILQRDKTQLRKELDRRHSEEFIEAFREKYDNEFPPVWMAVEVMSFGLLSKWFKNCNIADLKRSIAREVELPLPVLESILQTLTVYRNAAAHHSRLWNRNLPITPANLRTPPSLLCRAVQDASRERLQYPLAIAIFIVIKLHPNHRVRLELFELLSSAHDDWLGEMDFEAEFQTDPLWDPSLPLNA